MLRIRLLPVPKNVLKHILQDAKSNPSLHIARKQHSASSSGGSGLKVAAVLIGGAAASGGGVVAYAAYDADFRKSVEGSVPYSESLFDVVIGPSAPEPPKDPAPSKVDEGLAAAKIRRDKERAAAEERAKQVYAQKQEAKLKKEKAEKEAAALKEKEAAALKEQAAAEAKLKQEAEAAALKETAEKQAVEAAALQENQLAEEKLAAEAAAAAKTTSAAEVVETESAPSPVEETVIVEEDLNKELVAKLEDYHKKLAYNTDAAIEAVKEATKLVKEHASAVGSAVESPLGSKQEWETVTDLASQRADAIHKATVICEDVKSITDKLQSEIDAAKNNTAIASNAAINLAELVLLQHNAQLADETAQLSAEKAEAGNVVGVGDEVIKSRDMLMAEIKAIAPDFSVDDDSVKLSTEQLQQLVLHAYHRLLQKRPQTDPEAEAKEAHIQAALLQTELEKQKEQLEKDAEERLASAKVEFELELHTQLKRASSAWSEHEKELLVASEERLNRTWERRLQDSLFDEQTSFRAQIGQANARVKGITEGLRGRIKLEKAAKQAQDMWVACVALQSAIKHGGSGPWESKIKPLHTEVDAIKRASGGDESSLAFVVTSSLPDETLQRGVYTEDALKERFLGVSRTCRKVALLGGEGSSLWQRFISNLHSVLRRSVFIQPSQAELQDNEIDVDSLDNNDIIDRVRYCLDADDLEQAVRYANLLYGESRHYASEWLSEARKHLEARQVAAVLIAHATTVGIQALLSS